MDQLQDPFLGPSGRILRTPNTSGGNGKYKDSLQIIQPIAQLGTIVALNDNIVNGLGAHDFVGDTYRSTSTLMRWQVYNLEPVECNRTYAWWFIWDYQPNGALPTWAEIFQTPAWTTQTNRSNESRFKVIQKGFHTISGDHCWLTKTVTGTVSGYTITTDSVVLEFVGFADLGSAIGPVAGPVTGTITQLPLGGITWTVPTQDISFDLPYQPNWHATDEREHFVKWPVDAFTEGTWTPAPQRGAAFLCLIHDSGITTPLNMRYEYRHNFTDADSPV